jgi:hypothetical protein
MLRLSVWGAMELHDEQRSHRPRESDGTEFAIAVIICLISIMHEWHNH